MVSDTLVQAVVGYGLVFDRINRINRINRIEGDGRNAEGAEDAKRGKSVTNIHVIPSQEPITLD